jgi:hypothetical protein
LAAAMVLALTGCSSSTPAADSAAAKSGVKTKAPKVSATTPPPGKPVAGCFKVGSATGAVIFSGAKPGTGAKFVRASAVQSPYYGKMYIAAVEFSTTSAGKNVGVFAVSQVTADRLVVLSVDGKAKQFTVWQDTDHSATKISAADPYVAAAKACLK